jgi:hypothetical protein
MSLSNDTEKFMEMDSEAFGNRYNGTKNGLGSGGQIFEIPISHGEGGEEVGPDGRIMTTTVSYEGGKKIIRQSYRNPERKGSYREPSPRASYKEPSPRASYKEPSPRASYKEPSPRASYRQATGATDVNRSYRDNGDTARGSNYSVGSGSYNKPTGTTVQAGGLTKTSLNQGANLPPRLPPSSGGPQNRTVKYSEGYAPPRNY